MVRVKVTRVRGGWCAGSTNVAGAGDLQGRRKVEQLQEQLPGCAGATAPLTLRRVSDTNKIGAANFCSAFC